MTQVLAVVLDYFGSERTVRCLKSLSGQGLSEVRLVDNSGDPAYQSEFSQRLQAIRTAVDYLLLYEANQENVGFGKGVNQALRASGSHRPFDYVLLVNNDAELKPGAVETLSRALTERPQFGMVAPVVRSDSSSVCVLWYQRHTGLITRYRTPGSFSYISGACLLIDVRAISGDLFDEAFFMYGEDVELNWRLKKKGYTPSCIRDVEVYHLGSGSSKKGQMFYEFHVLRGHMLLAKRLARRRSEVPMMYVGRLVALGVRAIVRSLRYRKVAPVRAMAHVLAGDTRLRGGRAPRSSG